MDRELELVKTLNGHTQYSHLENMDQLLGKLSQASLEKGT